LTENQGINQQLACENEILLLLLQSPLGAEQIVKESYFSKATVYKYLRELYENGLIEYENPTKKFGEVKRPYRLTATGVKEAKKQGFIKTLLKLPPETVQSVLSSYKLMIAYNIMGYYKEMIDRAINRRLMESQIQKYTEEVRQKEKQ
jgi:predicted transcriptional regulator